MIKVLTIFTITFIMFFAVSMLIGTLTDTIDAQVQNMSMSSERETFVSDHMVTIRSVCNIIFSISAVGIAVSLILIKKGYDFGGSNYGGYDFYENM